MASQSFQQRSRALLFSGACLMLVGCVTPQYLMPAGYSSTYQKALFESAIHAQQVASAKRGTATELDTNVLQHASSETAILY